MHQLKIIFRFSPESDNNSLNVASRAQIPLLSYTELGMAFIDDPTPPRHAHILAKACCKKSFSTVNWPILACSSLIWVSLFSFSACAFPEKEATIPSLACFFHFEIWLACTPYLLESSAIVISPVNAAKATRDLNSAQNFLLLFGRYFLFESCYAHRNIWSSFVEPLLAWLVWFYIATTNL